MTSAGGVGKRLKTATQLLAALALVLLAAAAATAGELYSAHELRLRWDTTIKYSAAWRVQKASATLLSGPNGDDGDRNFDRGFISNRVDALSELDLVYRGLGARVSGAGWYDLVYNRRNDNDSPGTANALSVAHDEFTTDTRNLHGRKIELLDCFGFLNTRVASVPLGLRAGRYTLLWGESLLIADNGISNAQAPIDAIKGLSVPASQAKELFMPVTQISGQIGPLANLTLAGFYQLEWRRTRLPAAGSYFSSSDVVDAGGERLLLPMPAGAALFRGRDLQARHLGQWGASLHYLAEGSDTDLGVYFLTFHDRLPQVYTWPGVAVDPAIGKAGEYALVFQEGIRLVGASFATAFQEVTLQGEAHMRLGTPLASTAGTVTADVVADNRDNPLYAIGDTIHAQLASLYVMAPGRLWDSASLAAEVGGQAYTRITKNPGAFAATHRDRYAVGVRMVFTPAYYNVLPSLDLSVPLSFAYNPSGKAPLAAFNGGTYRGGTASLGASLEYRKLWQASVQGSWMFGQVEFQPRKDRGFVSLAVQRTF
jgi:hypothetical protein